MQDLEQYLKEVNDKLAKLHAWLHDIKVKHGIEM